MNYPNWRNGNADVFHEKHPQYPIYSLPFRGDSQYKESFTPDQMSKIRNQTIRVQKGVHQLSVPSFHPNAFEHETTNQTTYKDFRFSKPERTVYQQPAYHPVNNKAAPRMHFKSLTRKDHVKHDYKQPALDFIPYP